MLNSRRPRPTSSARSAGSDAISPQSDTGILRRAAARRTMTMTPQHRRMQRLVQARHALVGAIDRQAVLNQIVRADREEVHFARQQIRGVRGRRHFDHHADRHGRTGSPRAPLPRRPRRRCRRASRTSLDARHEREHDAERPWRAARSSARSCVAEELRRAPGSSRRPRRPCRLPAPRPATQPARRPPRTQLLLVHVERADRHRVRAPSPRPSAVDRVLRLFVRPPRAVERASSRNSER